MLRLSHRISRNAHIDDVSTNYLERQNCPEIRMTSSSDPQQFVTLSNRTLNSSSAQAAVAELRNEGLVEEQVRGVIRLTARGYRMYKNAPLPYAYAG
jgi:hypothetical protein